MTAIRRLCGRCLTTLGNLHMYMEGGHMRMGLCVIHKKLIQELRQDIAAAFTCLSGLIINKESGESSQLIWLCNPWCSSKQYICLKLSNACLPTSPAFSSHHQQRRLVVVTYGLAGAEQGELQHERASQEVTTVCADEDARETMENLCSAALEFQATMYSLPIRAEYNIHVETLALFSKISTSVARQVACLGSVHVCGGTDAPAVIKAIFTRQGSCLCVSQHLYLPIVSRAATTT